MLLIYIKRFSRPYSKVRGRLYAATLEKSRVFIKKINIFLCVCVFSVISGGKCGFRRDGLRQRRRRRGDLGTPSGDASPAAPLCKGSCRRRRLRGCQRPQSRLMIAQLLRQTLLPVALAASAYTDEDAAHTRRAFPLRRIAQHNLHYVAKPREIVIKLFLV